MFYRFVKNLFYILFRLFYKHKVYGLEHVKEGAALIASNHASFLDPPLIAASMPGEIAYLARHTLFNNFLFGFIIRNLNAHPITGTAQDISSIKLICGLLKDNQKVLVFPEGERSADGVLAPFKAGIGMLALRNNCSIIPVYIHGSYEIWKRSHKYPKLAGQSACVFGSSIPIDEYKDKPKKEAQEAIASRIRDSLNNLCTWYLEGAQGSPP